MRPNLLLLVCCITACQSTTPASTSAPADSAAGEVPFELAGTGEAAMIVAVMLNGTGPYDFVLDTGATLTCIDQALADSLNLPEARGAIGVGAGVGGGGRMRIVQLDSVRVGGAVARKLPGCTLDLGHIQNMGIEMRGLLGLNFLKPFRVTIDFERSVVRLEGAED